MNILIFSFWFLSCQQAFLSCVAQNSADSSDEFSHPLEGIQATNSSVLHDAKKETYSFQAEVSRLLDTIINSLYTEKDIFLRELISNAADGLEKARFLSINQPQYLEKLPTLEIFVSADEEKKTITIKDTGVGMTKKELIENLGTVAQSGTTNFLEAISNGTDVNLIGQFGVGFYSAFLVANNVTVISKSESDPRQHIWQSSATNSFTVKEDPRGPTLIRGTEVILYLRDDMLEFLDTQRLEATILKYNQYVNYPINIYKQVTVKEDPEKDANVTQQWNWTQVNNVKPIWMRNREDLTPEDYKSFFKSLVHTTSDPLAYTHFVGEGEIEFRAIIYIPNRGLGTSEDYFSSKQEALKLYARRVLVADSFHDLIPRWMSFIKGVVDSDDLPLKVDRESLSQSKVLRLIIRKTTGKVLDLLSKLEKEDKEIREKHKQNMEEVQEKDDPSKSALPTTTYQSIWSAFGKAIWLGCIDDNQNKQRISKILRFRTSISGQNERISFNEYIARMPESQKQIYYYSSDNYLSALASPHMQIYMKKGFEVIILDDPVAEPCLQRLRVYDSKSLISIETSNAGSELTKEDKSLRKRLTKAFRPLLDAWKNSLAGEVNQVKISLKLVDTPAVVTAGSFQRGAYSDRILRSQAFASDDQIIMKTRYLDINPHHPLIQKMLKMAVETPEKPELQKMMNTIYQAAELSSGYLISNPTSLAQDIFKFVQTEVGLSKDEPIQEFVLPEETEEEAEEESKKDNPQDILEDDDFMDNVDQIHHIKGNAQSAEDVMQMIHDKMENLKEAPTGEKEEDADEPLEKDHEKKLVDEEEFLKDEL